MSEVYRPKSVCAECKWLHEDLGASGGVWDFFCRHPSLKRRKAIDPLRGERCFLEQSDSDAKIFTEHEFPHATTVNPEGDCCLFQAMGRLKKFFKGKKDE